MASTAKGFAGILVTCDRTKERQVVKDILNILNDTADKHYPKDLDENDDDDDDADDDSKTSAEKLAEEIKGLKKDKGRFIALDSVLSTRLPCLSYLILARLGREGHHYDPDRGQEDPGRGPRQPHL